MASKTTRKTTSLNQDQLRSLETFLADAYNLAGLNDIKHDKDKQQRKDVIGNIDNPSYSVKNKTKIENFKRHLSWKLKNAKVEGIKNLESFFDAIEKSKTILTSYPNLANLKENLSTKVTVESPAPTSHSMPPSLSRRKDGSDLERSSNSSNLSVPPYNVQDLSKELESESPRYSIVTSSLNQNNKIEVGQEDFFSVFAKWGALVSGLLNQQGEKNKPELPPQKDPPIARTFIKKPPRVQSSPQPEKFVPPYSHSAQLSDLLKNFDISFDKTSKKDKDNNISYNQIKNDKDYFDQRVAKWDAELKVLNIATREPRKKNEPREMGFEGYVKYLDKNIEKLKLKEADTSVNQDQLKTLIAFHYLEKAKVLYSSGKLHLDGIEGGYFKKESVFDKVPEKYRSSLFNNKFKISQNSYTLPNLEKEPTPEVPQFSSQLNKPPAMSARAKIAMINALDATKEAFEDEASFIKNEMGGRRVLEGVKAVGSGIRRVGDLVDHSANDFADAMVQTGVRAKPNTSRVPQDNFIATSLGYRASGSDVRAHDSRLREEKHKASILERDTQPGALARNLEKRRGERSKAMDRQRHGENFYTSYNATNGGRNGGR